MAENEQEGKPREGLLIGEATLAAVWNVQGDPEHPPAIADVERRFGVALPRDPNCSVHGGGLLALWIGPCSWLLIEGGAAGKPEVLVDLETRREELNAGGGAVFDVSAGRVAYTLRGPGAAKVLAAGCPLDLDRRVFPPGHCGQSVFGRVSAVYYRHAHTDAFTLMVARSLAADVWRDLGLAAAGEGPVIAPLQPFDAS